MSGPHWENLKEIFHGAAALPLRERAAYLDQACEGNQSIRVAVESLLKAHEESNNFVDAPAYLAAADLLTDDQEFKMGERIAHYQIRSVLGEGGMGKDIWQKTLSWAAKSG